MNPPELPPATLPVEQPWLQDIINQKYGTTATIKSIVCDHVGIGKGFLSDIVKVDMTWSKGGEQLPKAIVIKIPTVEKVATAGKMGELMKEDPKMIERHHNTELSAYHFFTKFGDQSLPMAEFIYGEKRTVEKPGLLIVKFVEGRSMSLNEDSSLSQIKTLIKSVAGLQAYGILHGAESFESDKHTMETFEKIFKHMDTAGLYPELQNRHPEDFPFTKEQVEKNIVDITIPVMHRVIEGKLPYPPVVVLGDTQPNNVLWKVDNDGNMLDEVNAFLDFQVTHLGYCMFDVTNLIYWGLLAEDRGKYSDDLIQLFYDTLKAKVGADKMPLSLDGMKKEYKQVLCVFVGMYVPFLAQMEQYAPVMGFSEERVKQLRKKASSALAELITV